VKPTAYAELWASSRLGLVGPCHQCEAPEGLFSVPQ